MLTESPDTRYMLHCFFYSNPYCNACCCLSSLKSLEVNLILRICCLVMHHTTHSHPMCFFLIFQLNHFWFCFRVGIPAMYNNLDSSQDTTLFSQYTQSQEDSL